MYDDMPAKMTINQWRNTYSEFAAQYAQVKISQIEALFDEIIDIADDSTQDEMVSGTYPWASKNFVRDIK